MRARSIHLLLAVTAVLASAATVEASPIVTPPSLWISAANGDNPERLVRYAEFGIQTPAWSPDSTRIAFNDPYLSIVDVSSGERQRVMPDSYNDYEPDWSPDGSSLAFSRIGSTRKGIYVVDVESGDVRRLTSARDYEPDWSPDGDEIAFTRDGKQGGVFVVDAITGIERRLVGDVAWRPGWSPDGTLIGYLAGDNVYTVRPDGTGVTNLSRLGATIHYVTFSWSPDSTQIVLARSKLIIVDVATKERTRLRPEVGGVDRAAWSHNGERIVFDNFDHVYSIRADGSGLKRLTVGRDAAESPDGSKIAFFRSTS